jgi:hypothetical protein
VVAEAGRLIEREPDEAARMRTPLDRHLGGKPEPDVLATDIRIDPGIEQRLRAMGCLQEERDPRPSKPVPARASHATFPYPRWSSEPRKGVP